MPKPNLVVLAATVFACALAAQRPVVTVGGPNPDHADLPAAIAAAAPGSIVEVRSGVYTGFTCQKALRIFDTVARLSSDGTSGLYVTGAPVVPVSPFEAFDSEVYWNPSSFALGPANGAPVFSSQTTMEVIGEVPMLNAGPAELGGMGVVRMAPPTPAFGMIAVGFLVPTPIVLPPAGVYPNPSSFVMAGSGLIDAAGLALNIPIVNDPAVRGDVMVFQGIAFFPSGGTSLSGPALWYIE
jgi:hypothetical protein